MKQLKLLTISLFILALLLGAEAVNAYMMYGYGMYGGQYGQPYYPTRNYYMMDYYYQQPYSQPYYNPYSYAYSYPYTSRGFFTNYYNDPNWKYYALDMFERSRPYYGY